MSVDIGLDYRHKIGFKIYGEQMTITQDAFIFVLAMI